ncbi:MAG: c-type cytochrome domain-containing protein [Aureliella sp.]
MRRFHHSTLFIAAASLLSIPAVGTAEDAKPAEKKITFEEHIKPIFREHCTACHSESDKESDLALDTYGNTLAGGSSGEIVKQNDVDGSRLFALVNHAEGPFMPPDQDPIDQAQRDLIKTWIEQGMPENAGSKIKRASSAATAMLGTTSLGKPDGPPPMPERLLKEPVLETQRSSAISAMAASPWAPLIAVGGQQQVSLYHCETGDLLGIIPFPEGEPQSITFTRDGMQLLIAGGRHSHSGCAVLVDVKSGERIAKVGDELDTVLAADITPDKKRIALAGPQKIIRIYDTLTGELVLQLKKHTDWIFALRYSPDGILLASGDRSNGLIVWEADSGNLYSQLSGHKDAIRGVDFRADSNVLASCSLDGTIKLWDMFESKQLKSWNGHGGGVTSISFCHSGSLATSGRDGRIKTWDGNGKLQKEYKGLSDAALEVSFTGDGHFVAGGDWNGKVQLWPATDPAKPRLIAANPISVGKRVVMAAERLREIEKQHEALAKNASTTQALADSSSTQLTSTQNEIADSASLIQSKSTQQSELGAQVSKLDEQIAALQKQLQAKQARRVAAAKQKQQVDSELKSLVSQKAQRESKFAELKKQHTNNQEQAKQAQAALQAVSGQLTLAQKEHATALADQRALEARKQALKAAADQATARVIDLTKQLDVTTASQSKAQEEAASIQQELSALEQQVQRLQQQLAAVQQQSDQKKSAVESAKAAFQKIKGELESAEQNAMESTEKLELFEKSYRKPQ